MNLITPLYSMEEKKLETCIALFLTTHDYPREIQNIKKKIY